MEKPSRNMDYFRFQHALSALEDCKKHLFDHLDTEEEFDARNELIELCLEFAKQMEV